MLSCGLRKILWKVFDINSGSDYGFYRLIPCLVTLFFSVCTNRCTRRVDALAALIGGRAIEIRSTAGRRHVVRLCHPCVSRSTACISGRLKSTCYTDQNEDNPCGNVTFHWKLVSISPFPALSLFSCVRLTVMVLRCSKLKYSRLVPSTERTVNNRVCLHDPQVPPLLFSVDCVWEGFRDWEVDISVKTCMRQVTNNIRISYHWNHSLTPSSQNTRKSPNLYCQSTLVVWIRKAWERKI